MPRCSQLFDRMEAKADEMLDRANAVLELSRNRPIPTEDRGQKYAAAGAEAVTTTIWPLKRRWAWVGRFCKVEARSLCGELPVMPEQKNGFSL